MTTAFQELSLKKRLRRENQKKAVNPGPIPGWRISTYFLFLKESFLRNKKYQLQKEFVEYFLSLKLKLA